MTKKTVKPPKTMSVAEAAGEYIASLSLGRRSIVNYRQRLFVFADWCYAMGIALEQIKPSHVNRFVEFLTSTHVNHKGGSLSDATVAGYVQIIKIFLGWCANPEKNEEYAEYVKPITPRAIGMPKVTKRIVETFTDEQIAALKMACKQNYNEHLRLRDEAILCVLLSTGVRASELCALTIGNTHLEPSESYIKVTGKGKKQREIPIDTPTRRILKRYLRDYRVGAQGSSPLFAKREGVEGLAVAGLESVIGRLGMWAHIDESTVRCSPHTFRHTFAARFMRNGGDVYMLRRQMGHEDIDTTSRYLESLSSRDIRLRLQGMKE